MDITYENDKYVCKICDRKYGHNTNAKTHYLNNHADIQMRKQYLKYFCNLCNYGSFSVLQYNSHCKTDKHNSKTEPSDDLVSSIEKSLNEIRLEYKKPLKKYNMSIQLV